MRTMIVSSHEPTTRAIRNALQGSNATFAPIELTPLEEAADRVAPFLPDLVILVVPANVDLGLSGE